MCATRGVIYPSDCTYKLKDCWFFSTHPLNLNVFYTPTTLTQPTCPDPNKLPGKPPPKKTEIVFFPGALGREMACREDVIKGSFGTPAMQEVTWSTFRWFRRQNRERHVHHEPLSSLFSHILVTWISTPRFRGTPLVGHVSHGERVWD